MLTLSSPAQKKEEKKGGRGGGGGKVLCFKKVHLTHSFEAFLPLPDCFPEEGAGTVQIVLQYKEGHVTPTHQLQDDLISAHRVLGTQQCLLLHISNRMSSYTSKMFFVCLFVFWLVVHLLTLASTCSQRTDQCQTFHPIASLSETFSLRENHQLIAKVFVYFLCCD